MLKQVQLNIMKCNQVQPNSTNSEQLLKYEILKKLVTYITKRRFIVILKKLFFSSFKNSRQIDFQQTIGLLKIVCLLNQILDKGTVQHSFLVKRIKIVHVIN